MKTTLATHSGFRFEVRRARPDDEPLVAEFFTHVTPEDMRFRFLGAVREVSHERLVAMTRSDDPHIHNFLAFSTDGMLIAVATLAADPADRLARSPSAFARTVSISASAGNFSAISRTMPTTMGIETLESIESRENRAAIELEREMGFTVATVPDDPTLVLVQRKLGATLAD
ncbi:GNAT family N-acetyltransferase [Mesorhizobium sp. CA10]|uniref:GNAT family N-acetyltransferase n=1 Tax=Mesorhizobium sp. CA10 TaxID=588495 RepID=UPI001CCD240D|nr:GNAT family N-acetyltransferase [Mesorhizobium sp. CA10]MBZ9881102.1 GNAT family N-acetyltransferase [Mesorhizobium sp. CA10]